MNKNNFVCKIVQESLIPSFDGNLKFTWKTLNSITQNENVFHNPNFMAA